MANSRELAEQAFSILQDALKDSEQRAAELDAELKKKRRPRNKVEKQAQVLEHRLETLEQEKDNWQQQAAQLEEILENERVKIQQLKKKLDVAESGPDKVGKKEVNYWRSRSEKFDEETKKYKKRIADLRKELKARPEASTEEIAAAEKAQKEAEAKLKDYDKQIADHAKQMADRDKQMADRDKQITDHAKQMADRDKQAADHAKQMADRDKQISDHSRQMADRDKQIEELKAQNSQLNSDLADKHSELTEQASQLSKIAADTASKDKSLGERDQRISELADTQRALEEEKHAIREQIAGLEEELKEEKECTVNLSEIANERRERITELTDKLDEAVERYEEAKWKLERAGRFERLLKKRRTLINSLIEAQRAKQKSNTALKAGLDGLRKFKAKSEQQQQKLLVKVEELTQELKEAEDRLASQKSSKEADKKLRKAADLVTSLEERLEAQVAVIDNLENELTAAKTKNKTSEIQNNELSELRATVDARNETITGLEADINELQKQLGKLRGSESETMRLKAVQEKDQDLIDELQMQIDTLKAELTQQQKLAEGGAAEAATSSAAEIRKREAQIADLKRTIKDQEKEIAKLNEAVAGWQKKYEFISTEPPSAYQSAVEK